MKRLVSSLSSFTLILVLAPPIAAETVLARGVAANGGGEGSGTNHTTIGTVGQTCIGVVAGPATIHEIGFWYPPPPGTSALEWPDGVSPTRFSFGPAQPNPSGQVIHIRFAVPQRSRVSIVVYDVTGRQVEVLVNGEIDAGYHKVRVTTRELSSGVYFCRMMSKQFTETVRLILLR